MKNINKTTRFGVAALAAVLFTCIAPAAVAQTTTKVCEDVEHCLDIDVFGVTASVCITLRECRTVSNADMQTV